MKTDRPLALPAILLALPAASQKNGPAQPAPAQLEQRIQKLEADLAAYKQQLAVAEQRVDEAEERDIALSYASQKENGWRAWLRGTAVAWYAALVATAASLVQLANFLREKTKVKLSLLRNMVTAGDLRREGMTFAILRVTNAGRRPVNITHAYLVRSTGYAGLLTDTTPRIPHELSEGEQLAAYLDEAKADFGTILYFAVSDSTSRECRLNVAPWLKRARWAIKNRFSRKK